MIKIKTGMLRDPTNDPASFAAFQRAVGVELVFEDPFAGDHVGMARPRDELPGAVGQQGVVFILHRCAPGGIFQSGVNRSRHGVGDGKMSIFGVGLDDASFASCDHRVACRGRGRGCRCGGERRRRGICGRGSW